MKKVFNKDEVAHVWAQRSQDEGRTSNQSFYFTGDKIFSYGAHWVLGAFVEHKGETVVLLNRGTYGPTTGSQQRLVDLAVSHHKSFHVINPETDEYCPKKCKNIQSKRIHKSNFEHYQAEFNDLVKRASKARERKDELLQEAHWIAKEGNDYKEFFGVRLKAISTDIDLEAVKIELKKQAAIAKKKNFKRIAQEIKDNAEKLVKWKAGENVHIPHSMPVELRLIEDDEGRKVVQTTQGARFPASHCALLWRKVKQCVERGETWRTNGHTIKLGMYSVNNISSEGKLVAGCHIVSLRAMQEMAAKLSLPAIRERA